MNAPTLSTARLVLRPIFAAHKRQVDWLNNPKVVQFSEQRHRPHTLASCQRYVNSFQAGSQIWAIHLVADNRHIGNITAVLDRPNNVSELGILIGDVKMWGNGYATEAWLAATEWSLDKDGGNVRKLSGGCMKTNEAMLKVLRKTGFTFECERPAHFLFGSSPIACIYFARFQ